MAVALAVFSGGCGLFLFCFFSAALVLNFWPRADLPRRVRALVTSSGQSVDKRFDPIGVIFVIAMLLLGIGALAVTPIHFRLQLEPAVALIVAGDVFAALAWTAMLIFAIGRSK